MSVFKSHTPENAPNESREYVNEVVNTFSFLPNLHAVLAESLAAIKTYLEGMKTFEGETSLNSLEQQIVFQVSNFENNCHYCMPGHSFLMELKEMPKNIIESLREGIPLQDSRLEALRLFTARLLQQRGHISESALAEFTDAGYSSRQALEVLVGLSAKLISNFTNALAKTELDEPVKPYAWVHPKNR